MVMSPIRGEEGAFAKKKKGALLGGEGVIGKDWNRLWTPYGHATNSAYTQKYCYASADNFFTLRVIGQGSIA
jgi:hypothetical protein